MHTRLTHTIRLAARSLARARSITFIAVTTLAIGLASAVALMGMLDAGIRPLPVPDGDRIVELEIGNARAESVDAPVPVADWARGPGVQDAGALQQIQATLVHPDAGSFRLSGAAMDPAVLRLLRVPPALGRLPSHDVTDANAMVIGWSVWQEMGADAALLGAAIRVAGVVHTLIGVMPEGFGFPERQSFWTVLPPGTSGEIVARIDDDVRIDVAADAAQARLNAVASAAGAEHLPYAIVAERWTTQSRQWR